jgi:hypothetical protein
MHTNTRTLSHGISEEEEGLVTRIQLLGPSGGLRPSVRVSGPRQCNCQVVEGSIVNDMEGESLWEEHWICDFSARVNAMAAKFSELLLLADGYAEQVRHSV